MTQQIKHVRELERVGLSEKESLVYLTLFSIGTGTAYQIALRCEVKKPTVYIVLEDLRKKGLVLKVPHTKKALYSARDLAGYLAEQESGIKMVRSIVPELNASGNGNANVFFFNGIQGIKQAINYKLDSMGGKKISGFYSNLAEATPELLKMYSEWDRRCVEELGISFEIIMSEKGAGKYYQEIIGLSRKHRNVQIRFLKDYDYPQNQTIDMGDDFLRIVDETRLHATIVDDRQTAEAMRQIFKIVWEKGI